MFIKNYKLLKIWINKDAITGERLRKDFTNIWIETGYEDYERYFINQSTLQKIKSTSNKKDLVSDIYLSSEDVVSIRPLFNMKKEVLSTPEMEIEMTITARFRKDMWGNMEEFAATGNTLYEEIRNL
jgi:hypothetical protein